MGAVMTNASGEATTARSRRSRIIGVGASAGGLEALKAFFDHVPSNSQHSFVVIQHLSPEHKSFMAELLARNTDLPIVEAGDGASIRPGEIYLIPPRKNIEITDGRLALSDKPEGQLLNLPIDIFFRSLAKSEGEKAIAIVLTGTGSDGTRGVRAIKDSGGMVMIQDPRQAPFDGMPLSAMATGLADYVLPVEDMHRELQSFVDHPGATGTLVAPEGDDEILNRVFALVREATGLDFSQYKRPTLIRRVERRMTVRNVATLDGYLQLVENEAEEAEILGRECLICVTKFFRDGEVWDALVDLALPEIVSRAAEEHRPVRVWTVGCSTGEEAYTVAILLQEEIERQGLHCDLKVFATDLSEQYLSVAGRGAYPESIVADVWPERLSRYFAHSAGEYVVKDGLRSSIIFSPHNVIKDPPFKDIDLVLCRNMLIYFQPEAQKRALTSLHYALRQDGILMLSPSENVGDLSWALTELDPKAKIYRNEQPSRRFGIDSTNLSDLSTKAQAKVARLPGLGGRAAEALADALAGELGLAALFVDESFEIIHAVGEVRTFAHLPASGFSANLLQLLDTSLSAAVSTAVRQAKLQSREIRYSGVYRNPDQEATRVDIFVRPFALEGPGWRTCFAVILSPSQIKTEGAIDTGGSVSLDEGELSRIEAVEQELRDTRESLQSAIEHAETSNEELQSTNEELMAANEELQSTNEELQSMNEELHTVNAEHQQKINDLAGLNADMDNLLASTDIGTIFLDADMRIRRFTPVVQRQFNLRLSDVGRPLDHFTNAFSDLDNNRLLDAARQVLDTGEPTDVEIDAEQHEAALVKLAPFEARSGRREGVVMSFVDVSDLKQAQAEIAHQAAVLQQVLAGAMAGYWEYTPADDTLTLSTSAKALLGYGPDELNHESNQLTAVLHHLDTEMVTSSLAELGRPGGRQSCEMEIRCRHRDGSVLWLWCRGRVEHTGDKDAPRRAIGSLVDVTPLKEAETELLRSNDDLRQFAYLTSHDLQEPLRTVSNFVQVLDSRYAEALDDDGRQFLGIVSQATNRMQSLIRGILDYSRIGRDTDRSVVDTEAVANEVVADLASSIEDAGATVEIKPLPKVVGYEAELHTLFANLVSNALKFRRDEVEPKVEITATTDGDHPGMWRFSVTDNGIGIAPEHHERIFQIFNRLHNRDRYEGAGIGLAHCRKIVELHGGSMAVESTPGMGSTFSFTLNLGNEVIQ
jgi:two-component system CheB/CheR fusion protein